MSDTGPTSGQSTGQATGQPLRDEQALLRVLDVTRQLAQPLDLTTMLQRVVEVAREVLKADRGSLFLYDEAADELYTTVAEGTKEIRISTATGIAGECARSRALVNVPDCYADRRFNQAVDRQTGYRTRCLLAVPLIGLDDRLVGVMQLLNAAAGRFDAHDQRMAQAFASQAAVAIQRSVLLEERLVKLKLERDLDLARKIQQDVLPETCPVIPGYDLAAFAQPADETGGDIYDLIPLPLQGSDHAVRSLVLFLADATGHGIGPALSVTQARAMLRMGLRMDGRLDQLITQINAQVHQDLSQNRFITAFLGQLDPQSHEVTFQSAGQGPILHLRAADGGCDFQVASTVPLGIVDELPLDPPPVIAMQPGDLLVLLTDGFYEAMDPAGVQLGKERIGDYLAAHRAENLEVILQGLVAMLRDFTHDAPAQDDLTAVILRRQG